MTPVPNDAQRCPKCGLAAPTLVDQQPHSNIDDRDEAEYKNRLQRALGSHYELRGSLARGGVGVIYAAWDTELQRDVAVKALRHDIFPSATLLERFIREARAIAKLEHPNIVPVYSVGRAEGLAYIVMQRIDGESLEDVIDRRRHLDPDDTLPILFQTAEGLGAAHHEGIIHRDVKPSNIMLQTGSHRVQVMDFGIARSMVEADESLTETGSQLGTPLYMAPEQAEDPKRVDARADIYSFGATFYEVLTGRPPFQGKSYLQILFKHLTEPVIAPKSLNPRIDPNLNDCIERCLAKDPRDRFTSLEEVLESLQPMTSTSAWDMWDNDLAASHLRHYLSRRHVYLENNPNSLPKPDEYVFPNGRRIRIQYGDLVAQDVDAIVSSDDTDLSMGGGISATILQAAGSELKTESQRYVPVRPGRAVVTSAGKLQARFIFHGITLGEDEGQRVMPSRDLIAEIMDSCFYHADTLHVHTIAFPLLGAGSGGFPSDICLDTMFRFLAMRLSRGLTDVREARIMLFPRLGKSVLASHAWVEQRQGEQ